MEEEGYTVLSVHEGGAALKLISKNHVDLVITDMKMPKLKGDDLARSITQFNPDIPVIIMTAYGEVNEAVRLRFSTLAPRVYDTALNTSSAPALTPS